MFEQFKKIDFRFVFEYVLSAATICGLLAMFTLFVLVWIQNHGLELAGMGWYLLVPFFIFIYSNNTAYDYIRYLRLVEFVDSVCDDGVLNQDEKVFNYVLEYRKKQNFNKKLKSFFVRVKDDSDQWQEIPF